MITLEEQMAEILAITETTIKACVYNLKASRNVLLKNNIIMVIGAYTVGVTDMGKLSLDTSNSPFLWGKEGVEEIGKVEFFDKNKNVIFAQPINYTDWYKDKLRKAWGVRQALLPKIYE